MPSIFSRARTASTPSKASKPVLSVNAKTTDSRSKTPLSPGGGAYDEFGRQTPTQAQEGAVGFLPTALPADPRVPWAGMGGSPNVNGSGSSNGLPQPSQQPPPRQPYGLLSPARDAVLGLPDLARLVGTVCAALERNGLATPFVFSSLALDVRRATVVRLVEAFLATCTTDDARNARAEARWADEARFAGAHELGMCLRWGLSRVVRVEGGREVRGLFSWAWYERWRQEEAANAFPPTAYSTLLASLPAQLPPILAPLFALCNRLVAHSGTTGHTPPTLAAVLSPLLFGLCSSSVAFSYSAFPGTPTRTSSSDKDSPEDALFPTIEDFASFPALYAAFLRGARAAEHMLLACIREGVHDAEGRGLGAPTRLREWVGMYPASLEVGEGDNRLGKTPNPRRGAKIVRVVHVRRNVRSYSADLVKGGSTWAGAPGANTNSPNEWASSKAWRGILAGGTGTPRFSDSYRKRLDLAPGVQPAVASSSSSSSYSSPGSPYGASLTSAPSAYTASSTSLVSSEESTFKSLTDFKWGEFETLGFGSLGNESTNSSGGGGAGGIETRLKFDLTENARAERMAKRETLSWNDFSSSGFSRGDAPLSATLQFSAPLPLLSANSNSSSGSGSSGGGGLNPEMTKKLKKAHKALPAFGWDTAPVMGPEEVVEEAFVDVFCDLIWGGGWGERAAGVGGAGADIARECSWALVEYKSRSSSMSTQDGGATVVLYEEFVPREYRLALAGSSGTSRRRLPSIFSPAAPRGGGKTWRQAPTLNGRPYVLGAVPSPTLGPASTSTKALERDFEGMLRGQGPTKVISLGGKQRPEMTSPLSPSPSPGQQLRSPGQPLSMARTRSGDDSSGDSGLVKRQSGRFRLPGGMGANPSPGMKPVPAEAQAVEFETRMTGLGSDDEGFLEEDQDQRRRAAGKAVDADAWVDILVGSVQARRMGGQDAELGTGSGRRRRGVMSGPDLDLANMERAQALAAETMGRVASPDFDEIERRREQRAREREEERLRDSDVVEVERVPRAQPELEEEEEEEEEGDDGYGEESDDESGRVTPTHPAIAEARQRRVGYFDLHPDRRPPSVATNDPEDDDPRSLLSRADSEEEEPEIDIQPRNLDNIRPLPTPQVTNTHEFPTSNGNANGNGHSGIPIAAPKPTPGTPSKTSALIDMFREREQQQQRPKPGGPVPAPSRPPVRVAPAPAPAAVPSPATPPAPVPAPAPAPALPPAEPPKASPPLLEPDRSTVLTETGRASPARYVHGAPLHNVIEEEEEEHE
ncbi:hypothetical protein FB45DRAFT_795432 [Roridomyces roridus]|uniref:Meiotically up-regulated protein Msb1/Mug8 domain-containing protein n=1 Tax=Roridomyces roridus TaxID=1738132 RepID=A0AAD7BQ56_9AGAR|nr:hypothetical protein FB45DRAFT_795432 [Roridomyces roridus]